MIVCSESKMEETPPAQQGVLPFPPKTASLLRGYIMQDEVLEFINRRFPKDCNWLNGNCYYFALILNDRFPGGRIWYNLVYGHFLFEFGNKYYDFSGLLNPNIVYSAVPWDYMETYDKLWKERIVRDCIM